MDQKQFDAMLSDGETRLRRLKMLYEQWFLGFERVEPAQLRKEFEDLLALLKREQVGNTALRFRLQQLVQRHVTFSTHWRRVARQIEEGTYQRDVIRARRRARQDYDRDNAGPELELSYDVDLDDDLEAALEEVHRAAEVAAGPVVASTPGLFGDKPAASDRKIEPQTSLAASARAVFQAPLPPPTAAAQPPQPMAANAAGRVAAAPPPGAANGSSAQPVSPPSAAGGVRPPIGAWAAVPVVAGSNPVPAIATTQTNAAAKLPTAPRIALPTPAAAQAPLPPSTASQPSPRAISPFALPATPSAKPAAPKPPLPPSAAKTLGVISPPLTKPPANQQTVKAARAPEPVQAKPAQSKPVQPKPAPVASDQAAKPKPMAASGALSTDDVQRIYKQYVDARKQNAERVDNVKLDTIEKTLRGMLPQLEKKHAGKKIDFQVVVKDGKVALKPIAR